jgi:hypothetical protein
MNQRRQQRRRRQQARRARRKRVLAELAILAAIVGPVVGLVAVRTDIWAIGREHDSRQARVTVEDYDKLKTSVSHWVTEAKAVFDAAQKTSEATGKWPRGRDTAAYPAVYRTGTNVQSLQDGMDSRQLLRLLNALRNDIRELCDSTSFGATNRAAKNMLVHWRKVNDQIKVLRGRAVTRLEMISADS